MRAASSSQPYVCLYIIYLLVHVYSVQRTATYTVIFPASTI